MQQKNYFTKPLHNILNLTILQNILFFYNEN